MCVCVCMYVWRLEVNDGCLLLSTPYFFETVLSEPVVPNCLSCLASELQRSVYLHLASTGVIDAHYVTSWRSKHGSLGLYNRHFTNWFMYRPAFNIKLQLQIHVPSLQHNFNLIVVAGIIKNFVYTLHPDLLIAFSFSCLSTVCIILLVLSL